MALKTSTAERIKQIMEEKNLRQVDVIEKARRISEKYHITLSKANLSMYLSGKSEPAQDKLYLLSKVFGVSEAWLMGYDVPREESRTAVDDMPAWTAAFSGGGMYDARVRGFIEYLEEQAQRESEMCELTQAEMDIVEAYRAADDHTRHLVEFALGLKRGE